jgi:hypothetical protein
MRKTLILLFLVKPKSMDAFLADYARTTKEDILDRTSGLSGARRARCQSARLAQEDKGARW